MLFLLLITLQSGWAGNAVGGSSVGVCQHFFLKIYNLKGKVTDRLSLFAWQVVLSIGKLYWTCLVLSCSNWNKWAAKSTGTNLFQRRFNMPSRFANTACLFAFSFETTNLLVRCYSNGKEQRGILQLGKWHHWQSSMKEVILQRITASGTMGGVDTLCISVPGYWAWIWEQESILWMAKEYPHAYSSSPWSHILGESSFSSSCHCDSFIFQV